MPTMRSYLRGHKIEKIGSEWVFCDTKTPTVNNPRPCGYCGLVNTDDGHDGCLGELQGVMNACCGHGQVDIAYLQYWDGSAIYGKRAVEEIGRLKASIR